MEVLIIGSGAGCTRQCLSVSLSSSSSPAVATDALPGTPRAAVTASPAHICLLTLLFSTNPALNREELICTFCRQHPFLFIFLLAPPTPPIPPPLLLSDRAVLSGSSRAVGLSRVMDDYQPSAVFHYAPGRFTGSLTTRHENQSLFLILAFHPPSAPPALPQSRFLYFYIFSISALP